MLTISYNGKDITEAVSVNLCLVERSLCPKSSNATLVFNDAEKNWPTWGAKIGDRVSLAFDGENLGNFDVDSMSMSRGTWAFELTSGTKQRETTFSGVFKNSSLKDTLRTLTSALNLDAVFFGDFSGEVSWMTPENQRVYDILENLGRLFSFVFLQDAGKLRFITFDYLRNTDPQPWELESQDEYAFSMTRKLGRLTLSNGKAKAEAEDPEGTGAKSETFWGVLDLGKAAENALAAENMKRQGGQRIVTKHKETPLHYPGQVLEPGNTGETFQGRYLVSSVLLDVGNRKETLTFWRL